MGDAADVPPRRSNGVCDGGAPVYGIPTLRVVYSLLNLAQQDRKVTMMLTEGSGRAGRPCGGVGVVDRWWRLTELVDRAAAGHLRAF